MFNGKLDQIAFLAHSDEDELAIKKRFGLEDAEWTEDHVVASGTVRGEQAENEAKLLFNYDLGIELEILRYTAGENYTTLLFPREICHIGFHHSGEGDVPSFDAEVIQQVETSSHTNVFLLESGRRYRYTIYDTYAEHGVYMKVIERIEPPVPSADYLPTMEPSA
jgi:hypothetical protein